MDDTTLAETAGEIRYSGGRFSLKDAVGEFDPHRNVDLEVHRLLDTLVHEIDESSYDEIVRSGSQVTSIITWETAAKLKKIREEIVTRSGDLVTQIVWKQYDSTGTLAETLTEVFNYVGTLLPRVDSVTRTRTVP